MPLPRRLADFNKVVTNHIAGPLASRVPTMAVIVHRGRISGTEYRTPVNCWIDDRTAIVALTYGSDTDWLKNLTAAGGGTVVARGRSHRVGRPEVVGVEGMIRMPGIVRRVLGLIDVTEFAELPLVSRAQPT
jgi:deazaflavin-dependent oxidoreductase (nitroreductase family)